MRFVPGEGEIRRVVRGAWSDDLQTVTTLYAAVQVACQHIMPISADGKGSFTVACALDEGVPAILAINHYLGRDTVCIHVPAAFERAAEDLLTRISEVALRIVPERPLCAATEPDDDDCPF
jgi:hypothetical protein